MPGRDILLGTTRSGNKVHLPSKLRQTHMHVLGASGRGKSKFLEHLIRQDILAGEGLCLIDPHGYLCDDLLRWVEEKGIHERRKVAVFDPTLDGWAAGFNPLQFGSGSPAEIDFGVNAMVRACAQVWGGEDMTEKPLLSRTMRCVFYALAAKGLTLLEAQHLVSAIDPDGLRAYLTAELPDSSMRMQWREFNALRPPEFREQFGSINNRLMEFLAGPLIRAIIGRKERVVDFRALMDQGAVLFVNLAQRGRLAHANGRLLGTLLVNDLLLKALGRPPHSRPYFLYIDECARFINEDVGRILDEARKFGLHLTLAHQHLAQLRGAGESVYSAVMTNAQTKIVFGGLSPEDAETMAGHVFAGEYNLQEAKEVYNAREVYGYTRVWLEQHSQSYGVTRSRGSSTHQTTGTSERTDGSDVGVETTSAGIGNSVDSSEASGWAEGMSESLMPLFRAKPTQGYSLEEQVYRSMAIMMNQPTRHAIVKMPAARSRRVLTPEVRDSVPRDERIKRLIEALSQRTDFVLPADLAAAELERRHAELVLAARSHGRRKEPSSFRE